jgi:hypothetical protein
MPYLTTVQAQWMTLFFILAVTFLVIVYDLWVIQAFGVDASISRVIQLGIERYPMSFAVLLLTVGIFIGHVWLPSR